MRSRTRCNPLLALRYFCKIDHLEICEHLDQILPIPIYEVVSQSEVLILMDLLLTLSDYVCDV